MAIKCQALHSNLCTFIPHNNPKSKVSLPFAGWTNEFQKGWMTWQRLHSLYVAGPDPITEE